MNALFDRLLKAQRKGLFRSRSLFELHAPVTQADLSRAQQAAGAPLPAELTEFLATVGFGDIAEELSFRAEWFSGVDSGELKGAALFAQDILGNFYGFVPPDGRIVFFSRSEPGYAVVAGSFGQFLEELERRDYKLVEWVRELSLQPYAWQSA